MIFKDINFKISILGALHDLGYYNKEAEEIKDENSEWDNDYEPIPAVLEFYKKLEIDPEYLEKIETLQPDGGDMCYQYLFNEWDGEDDQFDITSIEGIEHLENLKIFRPISMVSQKGVDYSPLLQCSKLKKVSSDFAKDDKKNKTILEQLKAKGVETI